MVSFDSSSKSGSAKSFGYLLRQNGSTMLFALNQHGWSVPRDVKAITIELITLMIRFWHPLANTMFHCRVSSRSVISYVQERLCLGDAHTRSKHLLLKCLFLAQPTAYVEKGAVGSQWRRSSEPTCHLESWNWFSVFQTCPRQRDSARRPHRNINRVASRYGRSMSVKSLVRVVVLTQSKPYFLNLANKESMKPFL